MIIDAIVESDLDILLKNGKLFDKMSDICRIVDPVHKKVIKYKDNGTLINDHYCFSFWDKNKICQNCISMRAYNENNTYVKIEYVKDKIYMITAVPYDMSDRRVVIEILKDNTNSMFFDSDKNSGSITNDIHTLVDNLNRLAFIDPLTNLFNRRYIMERLPVDLLNSTLYKKQLTLIMADIDFFKKINDDYGHIAGDYTLKNVAGILTSFTKENDWVSRYGGEEFLVCMPDTNLEDAKKAAEGMRNALEKSIINYDDKEISVRASFGVYSIDLSGNDSAEDLLKHVDEKLYRAKRNGRNRVEY